MPPSREFSPGVTPSTSRGTLRTLSLALLLLLACALSRQSACAAESTHHRGTDTFAYDVAGRLFRITYHTGRITTYAYDRRDNIVSVTTSLTVTGAEEGDAVPLAFSLGRAHPNPGQATRFTFSLPHAARAAVRLFDISGRLVATVVEGEFPPGTHDVELRSGNWAAGVYFYVLDTAGFTKVQRFVHLK